jgi:hypothetical protein
MYNEFNISRQQTEMMRKVHLSMLPPPPCICLHLFLEAGENPGTASLMIEIGSPANRTESQSATVS